MSGRFSLIEEAKIYLNLKNRSQSLRMSGRFSQIDSEHISELSESMSQSLRMSGRFSRDGEPIEFSVTDIVAIPSYVRSIQSAVT